MEENTEMGFAPAEAARLLAECQRYCCVCRRRCGFRIELHHIIPGDDDIGNALPVCFDCHAEIESKGPRGRHFRAEELRILKADWLALCRDRPEILIQAAQRPPDETGPLEALLAELEYNAVAVGGDLDKGFPRLGVAQFERTIALNALAPLEPDQRACLLDTYRLVNDTNRLIEQLTHLTPQEQRSAALMRSTSQVLKDNRSALRAQVPQAIAMLETARGGGQRRQPRRRAPPWRRGSPRASPRGGR